MGYDGRFSFQHVCKTKKVTPVTFFLSLLTKWLDYKVTTQ
jgi:hypothetical protein